MLHSKQSYFGSAYSLTYSQYNNVADWDSIGRVITETRGRLFQTLGRAFSFLLNPQKLGRVFQRLD